MKSESKHEHFCFAGQPAPCEGYFLNDVLPCVCGAEGDVVGSAAPESERYHECERNQRDDRQYFIVAHEQTPRRARVAPVNEFEKSVDDDFLLTGVQMPLDQLFRELVEREDQQRDQANPAIGSADHRAEDFN